MTIAGEDVKVSCQGETNPKTALVVFTLKINLGNVIPQTILGRVILANNLAEYRWNHLDSKVAITLHFGRWTMNKE